MLLVRLFVNVGREGKRGREARTQSPIVKNDQPAAAGSAFATAAALDARMGSRRSRRRRREEGGGGDGGGIAAAWVCCGCEG